MTDPTPGQATRHTRPRCPHCLDTFEQLGVWIDEDKRTALFFCPHCGMAFGAQLLPEGLRDA